MQLRNSGTILGLVQFLYSITRSCKMKKLNEFKVSRSRVGRRRKFGDEIFDGSPWEFEPGKDFPANDIEGFRARIRSIASRRGFSIVTHVTESDSVVLICSGRKASKQ